MYNNFSLCKGMTKAEAKSHIIEMSKLALEDEARLHKKFMDEVLYLHELTPYRNLPFEIRKYQAERWYDIVRSN